MAQDMGLFGPDEYTARMMQEQNALKEIQAIDQGGPSVGVGILANRGFGQLRDAVGLEDPAMARGNKMKALVDKLRQAGIDMNDPEQFYPAFIQELQANGFQNEAMAMADKFRSESLTSAVKQSEILRNRATASKNMEEKLPELVRLQRALKQAIAAGDTEAAQQIADQITKLSTEDTVTVNEGDGEQQKQTVITKSGKKVFEGSPYKRTPLIENKGDDYVDKQIADEWGARAKEFQTARSSLNAAVPVLEGLKDIVGRGKYIQGSMSDIRTAIERGMNTLNLSVDPSKVSDSELFDSYVMQFVLPRMKMLGGSDSNEELAAIRNSVPNRQWSPESVQKFIKALELEQALVENKQRQYEAWLNNPKRPTRTFDFTIQKEERAALKKAMGLDQQTQKTESKPAVRSDITFTAPSALVKDGRIDVTAYEAALRSAKNSKGDPAYPEAEIQRRLAIAKTKSGQ